MLLRRSNRLMSIKIPNATFPAQLFVGNKLANKLSRVDVQHQLLTLGSPVEKCYSVIPYIMGLRINPDTHRQLLSFATRNYIRKQLKLPVYGGLVKNIFWIFVAYNKNCSAQTIYVQQASLLLNSRIKTKHSATCASDIPQW